MARLSRLQLPVFSVPKWSVDQHSPADPEAAKSKTAGGREVDRKSLEGRGGGGGGVVVGLALGRSQPTKPQLSMLVDMISLAGYPWPGQSLSLFFTCIFVMSFTFLAV